MTRRNHRKAIPAKVLYVRVSPELHDRISAIADAENRSLTAVAEDLLLEALRRRS